jgi:hypothetical protein
VQPRVHDPKIDKARHLIANVFCRLKEFRRIALRTDKTDRSFKVIIHLCAALINTTLNRIRPLKIFGLLGFCTDEFSIKGAQNQRHLPFSKPRQSQSDRP